MSAESKVGSFHRGLEGLYCHTFKLDGEYQHQGRIMSDLGNGFFLVLLFSEVDATPTFAQIASIADMRLAGWRFYESEADWIRAGEKMLEQRMRDGYLPPGTPNALAI